MCLSWLIQENSWWSSSLSNAGVAFILVAPFYWVTERLNASVQEENQVTRRAVAAIKEHVEQVEQDTKRRIEDLSAEVTRRLTAERNREKDLIERLRTVADDDDFHELLLTAHRMGWISSQYPPRVEVDPSRGLWIAVETGTSQYPDGGLGLLLFKILKDHVVVGEVCWFEENSRLEEMTLEDVMTDVGAQCRRQGFEEFDAGVFLRKFADLLMVASETEPEGKPVVACFGSDWVLTDKRLCKYTRPTYSVPYTRFGDMDWARHIGGKHNEDVDAFEEAYGAAQSIFPEKSFQHQPVINWG